jgi:lipid-binding SYLF domain-containing protein
MPTIKSQSKRLVNMGLILILGLTLILLANPAWAGEDQMLVDKAEMSLKNIYKENAWFRDHAKEAKAIFIVPELLRGAFIFGGAGGSGVLIVKQKDGSWSQPVFYTMGSASFGLQIGADASEIVLVVRTERGLEAFYSTDFRLGGDLSVAVGPAGAGARGGGITGDFVSFAKSKGAYAGISVDGQGVAVADTANMNYYGKPVRPTDVLVKGTVSNPGSKSLRETAKKLLK